MELRISARPSRAALRVVGHRPRHGPRRAGVREGPLTTGTVVLLIVRNSGEPRTQIDQMWKCRDAIGASAVGFLYS